MVKWRLGELEALVWVRLSEVEAQGLGETGFG